MTMLKVHDRALLIGSPLAHRILRQKRSEASTFWVLEPESGTKYHGFQG
jgi:hypothetical protein